MSSAARMPIQTIRPTVLFDLDGTLANTIDVIIKSYQHVFAELVGREVQATEARSWIGQTLLDTFEREVPGRAAEIEAAYREYNEAHLEEFVRPYPGVPQLLTILHAAGVQTGVITSKRRPTAEWTMRLAEIDAAKTPLLIAMEDTDAHKPDPAPLVAGAKLLGVTPSDCVYVGDAVFDLQAAQAAGMVPMAVTWGAGERADLASCNPHAICDSAPELYAALVGADQA